MADSRLIRIRAGSYRCLALFNLKGCTRMLCTPRWAHEVRARHRTSEQGKCKEHTCAIVFYRYNAEKKKEKVFRRRDVADY